jgi:acetyl-CoA synthetase
VAWFCGGLVNAAYNCIDRHLASKGDQPALIYEADDPNDGGVLTYRQLHDKVSLLYTALLCGYDNGHLRL